MVLTTSAVSPRGCPSRTLRMLNRGTSSSRGNFEPPALIQSMRTQVQDLDYDVPPILHEAAALGAAPLLFFFLR